MDSSGGSSASTVPIEQGADPETSPSDTRSSSDVFSTARNQINSLVGNTSVSDVSNKATTATSEAANGIKKTVLEDAIPATEEFLNNARDRISTMVGQSNSADDQPPDKNTTQYIEDQQRIDQMHPEQVCEFLRERHKSTTLRSKTS
ncbi:hypothetical protein N7470_007226 [Penicillium chermesinum]|nr:hypothetical protein N7470_007226 [Penicillium chermesinum]